MAKVRIRNAKKKVEVGQGLLMEPPRFQSPITTSLPVIDWKPADPSTWPDWDRFPRVALDLETCDPKINDKGPGEHWGAYILGPALAFPDGRSMYLPYAHHDPAFNFPSEKVLGYLSAQQGYSGEIVGANIVGYDLPFLAKIGIRFPNAIFRDVQIAEPLLDEHRTSYRLDALAETYELPKKEETVLRRALGNFEEKEVKGQLWRLPASMVGPYAERDAQLTLEILAKQEVLLREEGLWKAWEFESSLIPMIVDMRGRGVRIDLDQLAQTDQWLMTQLQSSLDEIQTATGCRIGPTQLNQKEALLPLFKHLNLDLPLTPTGQVSIRKNVLDGLRGSHPILKTFQQARELSKVRSTFTMALYEYQVDGRVYGNWHQLRQPRDENSDQGSVGTGTGRFSCTDINLQQQPKRNPQIGKMYRKIFIPEEGCLLADPDYRQIEPRAAADFTAKVSRSGRLPQRYWQYRDALRQAELLVEEYLRNPTLNFHQRTLELARLADRYPIEEAKHKAKTVGLSGIYCAGEGKMTEEMGLPTMPKPVYLRDQWTGKIVYNADRQPVIEKYRKGAGPEAQQILDTFFNQVVPWLKPIQRIMQDYAETNHYIQTNNGRKCRLRPNKYGDWKFYKGFNYEIQSNCANIAKDSAYELWKAGFGLHMVVHDQNVMSVESPAKAQEAGEIMCSIGPKWMIVPLEVEITAGPNWAETVPV